MLKSIFVEDAFTSYGDVIGYNVRSAYATKYEDKFDKAVGIIVVAHIAVPDVGEVTKRKMISRIVRPKESPLSAIALWDVVCALEGIAYDRKTSVCDASIQKVYDDKFVGLEVVLYDAEGVEKL